MSNYLILARYFDESPTPPRELLEGAYPTFWSDIMDSSRTLLICQFENPEAAEDQLKKHFTGSEPIVDVQTPDVRGVVVFERKGYEMENSAGEFLSLASLHVSPGLGSKMGDEMSATLQSLALMPGYLGHILGANTSLDEEIWALVLWTTKPPAPQNRDGMSYTCYTRVQ